MPPLASPPHSPQPPTAASQITNAVTATAAVGSAATGATSAITLGGANDTVSGNLNVVVGTLGLAKNTLSLNINPNSTGAQLASQVNQSSAFVAAGVSATYNATNNQVTLTGPVGASNTLATHRYHHH